MAPAARNSRHRADGAKRVRGGLPDDGGGPYYATLFMPLLIHEEAFDHLRFGDAAAMMLVLFWASQHCCFWSM
jgi:hypothetical protein